MITIAGLTAKQKVLMDVLWNMQDLHSVTAFVNSLPTQDRLDCLSLMQIAMQESLEEDGVLDAYQHEAAAAVSCARYS